jgi:hypothetical protein
MGRGPHLLDTRLAIRPLCLGSGRRRYRHRKDKREEDWGQRGPLWEASSYLCGGGSVSDLNRDRAVGYFTTTGRERGL